MFNFKRKQYWQEIPELIKNRNADIFIVSYPKSGRSWLRFMLSRYFSYVYQIDFELSKDITELTKSVNSASKIAFVHDGSSYTQNYNFSYDELPKESKKIYKNKKVILLVRDLRDVMVSYYLHCSKRDNIYHKEISDFIRDRKFGIAKAVEFLNIWYLNRNIPEEFMVIQYEDMVCHPLGQLLRICKFLQFPINHQYGMQTVEYSSFKNMKFLERSGKLKVTGRFGIGKLQTEESYKIRRGICHGFVDYFSKEDVEYLNHYINNNLNPFYNYIF